MIKIDTSYGEISVEKSDGNIVKVKGYAWIDRGIDSRISR